MWKDPNPNNEEVGPEEKDKRKFTLSLVFIVVIGLSMIAFILKLRQAKNEVKDFYQEDVSQQVPGLKPTQKWEKKRDPNTSDNSGPGTNSAPPSKFNKAAIPANKKATLPSVYKMGRELKFRGDYQQIQKQSFLEVENIKAFPASMKDRFSADEIIGVKNDRVYTFVKEGEDLEEALGVALNSRTKRMGLITGTLKIRFKDSESFDNRGQWIREPFYEKRSFVAIKYTLIEGAAGSDETVALGTLTSEKSYWQSLPGVKSVEVEILEGEITVQ